MMRELVPEIHKRRICIVGSGGRLGAMLLREYAREHDAVGFAHAQLDLAAPERLRAALDATQFDILINAAAQTNVDRCEAEREEAFTINAVAPGVLAEICAERDAHFIHISTDYVFDGESAEPYAEEDAPNPISVYGETKLEGERRVLAVSTSHLVVRVSWVFGPDRPSFVDWIVQRAREHTQVEAVADKFSTPTYTRDIAEMLRPLLQSHAPTGGILHVANQGRCSWREYGQWALDCAAAAGVALRARQVDAISLADMKNFVARRPVHTVMATTKYEQLTGRAPRSWEDAVAEYVRDHIAPAARD